MNIKKIAAIGMTAVMTLGMASCGNGSTSSTATSGGGNTTETIQVDFWTAPQSVQFNFWDTKAKAFNDEKIAIDGKIIEVKVQQMGESPSSEAAIQNAIATGTAPAISENINRGFAGTLSSSEVVYDLQDEDWFKEIIENRDMSATMDNWAIDGKQYVLPVYVNPMTWQWNAKALKALGFDAPPATLDEYKTVIQTFVEKKDEMSAMGVTHTMYNYNLTLTDRWWERWYDFYMPYMGLTGETEWVNSDNQLVLDKEGMSEAFELLGMTGNTMLTSELTVSGSLWATEDVPILFTVSAPWEISIIDNAGIEYGMDGGYVFGPSIVSKEGDTPYVFGDSKGLTFYKASNISDEQHNGAVEFTKWLYSAENNAQTDLDWMKTTGMLATRGDMTTNDTFKAYLDENPALAALTEYVPNAVPCMASDKMTQVQTALGEGGFCDYMIQASSVTPLEAPDPTTYVDSAYKAMEDALAS